MNDKAQLILELTKRYVHEIKNPSKEGYNEIKKKWEENCKTNKSKLKRLRLLLHEVMFELES